MWLLSSPFVQKQFKDMANKLAQPKLALKRIAKTLLPIPPLEEQQQIVEKIEFLMKEVDALEKRLKEKENISEKLSQAVVEKINESENVEELEENLRLIIENFDVIFETPKSMEELRNIVLQLAIKGKLVKQHENDEPASELIKRIEEEKKKMIKQNKIKTPNINRSEIKSNDLKFDLPSNWIWSKLYDITYPSILNDGDWIVSKDMSTNGKVKLIQLGSIGDMKYLDKGFKYITQNKFDELNCTQIYPEYLLINRLIGDKMYSCVLPKIDGKLITTVDTCWISPKKDYYNTKYLLYLFNSPYFQEEAISLGKGTTRLRISKGNLINIPIPIPPLNEQKRIVEKVDSIMTIIDKMEEELEKKYEIVEKLGSV
jgi:type I restriction enzyme S subunit